MLPAKTCLLYSWYLEDRSAREALGKLLNFEKQFSRQYKLLAEPGFFLKYCQFTGKVAEFVL